MTVLLAASGNEPPRTIGAAPAGMLSGRWRFTFTQTNELAAFAYFFKFGNVADDAVWCTDDRSFVGMYIGSNFVMRPCTWSLGQPVTLTVDTVAATFTISGATTGNGVFSANGGTPWAFASGSLGVGQDVSGVSQFDGTFSDVVDVELISSTVAAGVRPGLTGAATAAVRIAATGAGVQAGLGAVANATGIFGAGAGALAAIAGDGAESETTFGVAASTQPSLAGSAVASLRITGTAAGVQGGLAGAANATRINGVAAALRPGLTALAAGAARIVGAAAGVRPGAVAAAASISGRFDYLGTDGITLYPRRGETYPDADGFAIGSAGAYLPNNEYAVNAVMRGDLLTNDPNSVTDEVI